MFHQPPVLIRRNLYDTIHQYIGSLKGRKASRTSRRSSTVTDESDSTRILAIAFSRALSSFQVEGDRGSQNQANTAKLTVPAPLNFFKRYVARKKGIFHLQSRIRIAKNDISDLRGERHRTQSSLLGTL